MMMNHLTSDIRMGSRIHSMIYDMGLSTDGVGIISAVNSRT